MDLKHFKNYLKTLRRIDKILQELLDDTWQIIEKRENERIIEMNKPRPAKFENLFLVEVC